MEIPRLTLPQKTVDVEFKSQDSVDLFDCKGIVRREFVLPGQTVDQNLYFHGLERVRQRIRGVGSGMFPDKWILHHDNAPSPTGISIKEFFAKKNRS
jgi:hypothetical protein